LTKRTIDNLVPIGNGINRQTIWDDLLRCFGCRVSPSVSNRRMCIVAVATPVFEAGKSVIAANTRERASGYQTAPVPEPDHLPAASEVFRVVDLAAPQLMLRLRSGRIGFSGSAV
jgi:hypothetical protein